MKSNEIVQTAFDYEGFYNEKPQIELPNCTIPALVTSETPLHSLNLNWGEADLPERIRTKHVHRLHPYLGKYIPQIVEIFLRKYFKAGQTIFDPFCGSGTTLVEANSLGINSIGFDVSEFNVMLGKVKTTDYDLKLLQFEIFDILQHLDYSIEPEPNLLVQPDLTQSNSNDSPANYLTKWFAPQALHQLQAYKALIPNYEYQEILKVILSRSARSARLTTHFDLDFPKHPQIEPYYCYKHARQCQPTQDALKFLKRYSEDTLGRVVEFSKLQTSASIQIYNADSRTTKLPQIIDGVITSPPYVGLIDYHEQHRYAYELLDLSDNSHKELGAASNGKSKLAKENYVKGMSQVFSRVRESLNPQGKVIVVVNDKDELYPQIAAHSGFQQENVLQRHVNRRTGRRSGEFYESVLIWKI